MVQALGQVQLLDVARADSAAATLRGGGDDVRADGTEVADPPPVGGCGVVEVGGGSVPEDVRQPNSAEELSGGGGRAGDGSGAADCWRPP